MHAVCVVCTLVIEGLSWIAQTLAKVLQQFHPRESSLRGCVIQLHLARHSKTMFRLWKWPLTQAGRRQAGTAGRQAGKAIPILFPSHFLASKLGLQKEKREEGRERTNERTRLHEATPPPPQPRW